MGFSENILVEEANPNIESPIATFQFFYAQADILLSEPDVFGRLAGSNDA